MHNRNYGAEIGKQIGTIEKDLSCYFNTRKTDSVILVVPDLPLSTESVFLGLSFGNFVICSGHTFRKLYSIVNERKMNTLHLLRLVANFTEVWRIYGVSRKKFNFLNLTRLK